MHLGALPAAEEMRTLGRVGIAVKPFHPSTLDFEGDRVSAGLQGTREDFDCLYLALGCRTNSEIAVALGAAHDDDLNLRVDDHQRTSVRDLFAAGDVVRGLNQITVAGGEAAVAATAMHNRLREE